MPARTAALRTTRAADAADDRPGLDALGDLVGYRLRRAQLAAVAELGAGLAPLGLRPVTFSVLVVVGGTPGLSQAAVCDALGVQRANFVALAAEFEQRGLVSREPSPTDRRQYRLHLTADGRRALKRAWEVVEAHEARIAARLGVGGRRRLLALLEALY
jgi:DNA-binding MarR family transcriptional regulator